jgi:hypothetical protein
MTDYQYGADIPLGLGIALAQNPGALKIFASLPEAQKRQIIAQTHGIESKEEMQSFVALLTEVETRFSL